LVLFPHLSQLNLFHGMGVGPLRRVQEKRGRVLTTALTRRKTGPRGLGWRAAWATGPEGPGSLRRVARTSPRVWVQQSHRTCLSLPAARGHAPGAAKGHRDESAPLKDHLHHFLKSDPLQEALGFFFFFLGTTTRPEVGLPLSKMAESLLVSKGTSRNGFKREGTDCACVRVHATGRDAFRPRVGG